MGQECGQCVGLRHTQHIRLACALPLHGTVSQSKYGLGSCITRITYKPCKADT